MGFAYCSGRQRLTLDGSSAANLVADIKSALEGAGWTSSAISGGWMMTSVATPQGLQFNVSVVNSAGTCKLDPQTLDGTEKASTYGGTSITNIYTGGVATYEIITNAHSFWLYRPGLQVQDQTINAYACGVPYIPDPTEPLYITSATNASPIEITVSADHQMVTGDYCFVDGVQGNTGANGYFQITSTGARTFTLDGSTGTGAWTSGGLVGNIYRISRAIYVNTNYDSGGPFADNYGGWRVSPVGNGYSACWILQNQISYSAASNNMQLQGQPSAYPWRQSRLSITEPYVMTSNVSGGTVQMQYQLWNTALLNGTPQISIDSTTTFDSHTWYCYGSSSTCAIMVAYV